MASKKAKIAPAPWRVRYKQMAQSGKLSRPQVVDANGEPVNMNLKNHANLVALAPTMLALLEKVEHEARLWYLMLAGDHPGLPKPDWLETVTEAVRIANRGGLS